LFIIFTVPTLVERVAPTWGPAARSPVATEEQRVPGSLHRAGQEGARRDE